MSRPEDRDRRNLPSPISHPTDRDRRNVPAQISRPKDRDQRNLPAQISHPTDRDRRNLPAQISHQTIGRGQTLLNHIRRLRAVAALTAVLLLSVASTRPAAGSPLQLALRVAAMAIVLLAVSESYRLIAAYIRGEDQRNTELADDARRSGVALAVNTLQHHIGNKLGATVGYSEMLVDDPRLPPDLRALARNALTSATAAAAVVHKLDQRLAAIELDHSVVGPADVLDVDASTTRCEK